MDAPVCILYMIIYFLSSWRHVCEGPIREIRSKKKTFPFPFFEFRCYKAFLEKKKVAGAHAPFFLSYQTDAHNEYTKKRWRLEAIFRPIRLRLYGYTEALVCVKSGARIETSQRIINNPSSSAAASGCLMMDFSIRQKKGEIRRIPSVEVEEDYIIDSWRPGSLQFLILSPSNRPATRRDELKLSALQG